MSKSALWIVALLSGSICNTTLAQAIGRSGAMSSAHEAETSQAKSSQRSHGTSALAVAMAQDGGAQLPAPVTAPIPVSTENEERIARAKKWIWWGAGFSIGGLVLTAAGVTVFALWGFDDDSPVPWGLTGIGVLAILASTPVWVIGLLRKREAERENARREPEPTPLPQRVTEEWSHPNRARQAMDLGPPTVTVLTYTFRF